MSWLRDIDGMASEVKHVFRFTHLGDDICENVPVNFITFCFCLKTVVRGVVVQLIVNETEMVQIFKIP